VQAFVTSWGPAPADAADDDAGTRPPSAPAGG
jgi:hypothetical protein